MVDVEPEGQKLIVGGDHIDITVMRESGVQPITGLAGFSMADAIREDDVILCGIKELTRTEQDSCKLIRYKLRAGAAGSVEDEHGIINPTACVPMGRAQRSVVQAQFGQDFAILKMELADCEITFDGRRIIGW
jgi:hypothetical protein